MLGNYSDSFPVNAPWRLTFGWDDEDGVPIDLSALLANAIRMQVQLEDGSILEYDLDTGITLTPLVVNAAAVDVAFQADNLVRSTVAKFFSAGASDNQTVVLSAGSNAGT